VIFQKTRLQGAYIIEPERLDDERGFFARTYCAREFGEHGIAFNCVQGNISFNKRKSTLRGMHYQLKPHAEAKLVRCTMGAIYDVIVDLRSGSPTYAQWIAAELTADNRKMLFVPECFAHGFQSLVDNTETAYLMSAAYVAESSAGISWNDPALAIAWPLPDPIVNARDRALPRLVA
jgi:dTDP-4-dehydrorhamnose 3,5-epimerase